MLAGKQLALLDVLIKDSGYPDVHLVADILKGMPLIGVVNRSNYFPEQLRAATILPSTLKSSAKWSRRALIGKIRSSGDSNIDEVVWKQTLEEVSHAWMSGPFDETQVTAMLGTDEWVCSRRFGLDQGKKVRNIDDYSESQVNSTITVVEKIELDIVDEHACLLKTIVDAVAKNGRVELTLSTGEVLRGAIPAGKTVDEMLSWAGKTFDLKSAYRQLGTRPEEAWATILVVYDPHDCQPKFFMQHALPFGAVGSVVGFNRLSRALWALGSSWLNLCWTSFYDDFPTAEPRGTAAMCDKAVSFSSRFWAGIWYLTRTRTSVFLRNTSCWELS